MKDKCQAYIIGLFMTASIFWADVTVFDMPLNAVVILAATLLMLICDVWDGQKKHEPMFGGLSWLDIIIYLIGLLALVSLVGKIIFNPTEYLKEMLAVMMALMYYLLRKRRVITENQVMVFSIFGMITNTLLLWHYLVDDSFDFILQEMLNNNLAATWLVIVITINVVAFCIYDNKWFWHGANAVVGFFLLLVQKNIPSLVLTGILFFTLPFIYKPTKQLIKKDMQMFFVYAFMLCNMSLITGYTEVFDKELGLSYDLETSVYLELLLSVFGVFFFNFWDKLGNEDSKEDIKRTRLFFSRVKVVLMLLLLAFIGIFVKGGSSLMPEVINKIVTQMRDNAASQKSLLALMSESFGIAGVALAMYFLYSILESLRNQRKLKATRQQKFARAVAFMFVLQSIFLTQCVATTVIYLVFVIVCVNNTRTAVKFSKEADSYETDNTDSMLQRSTDLGDSAQ